MHPQSVALAGATQLNLEPVEPCDLVLTVSSCGVVSSLCQCGLSRAQVNAVGEERPRTQGKLSAYNVFEEEAVHLVCQAKSEGVPTTFEMSGTQCIPVPLGFSRDADAT